MELAAITLFLPFAVILFFLGITINTIQAACFLIIWPLSKTTYRKIIGAVTELFLLHFIYLMEWRAGLQVQLHADLKTYQLMGEENAILISNHISDVDPLIIWLLAQRCSCLHSALIVMKNSTKRLPIFGWAAWFFGCVFVNRSWDKDESNLRSSFGGLKDFPMPFWLTIFVEGTRMSKGKLASSQQFAISRGFPVPKNVLLPRTKGFVTAIKEMRSFVSAVYDVTLAVPPGHTVPSLFRFLKAKRCAVHVLVKRHDIKELPESDEGIAQWCRDRFLAKDAKLDKFWKENTFEEKENIYSRRSRKPLFVFISSASIFSIVGIKLIQALTLLSTWKGIAWLGVGLAIPAMLTHVYIEFTKMPQEAQVIDAAGRTKFDSSSSLKL